MVLAIMETEHFEFVVFGDSTTDAENQMNRAFALHLKEYDKEWEMDELPTDYYGVRTVPVVNHAAYRDGERIKGL